MDDFRDDEMPPELAEVARRLKVERPALSRLELDQIKLSVQRRAARPGNGFPRKKRRAPMKSRMAITSMLIAGILASSTGTGLAISGISSDGSAGSAQYRTERQDQQRQGGSPQGSDTLGREVRPHTDVAGAQDTDAAGAQDTDAAGTQDTDAAGAHEASDGRGASGLQATRQVGAREDGGLAFTGLAAIPLILMGIGMLATGAILRRRLPQGS